MREREKCGYIHCYGMIKRNRACGLRDNRAEDWISISTWKKVKSISHEYKILILSVQYNNINKKFFFNFFFYFIAFITYENAKFV